MAQARSALMLTLLLAAGCGQKQPSNTSNALPQTDSVSSQVSTAPGPAPVPAVAETIPPADNGNVEATLAELTRELHRTMIGRKLSGSFEEFVAVRNLKPPPPPPGKRYAISKQWRVILVDAK